MKNSRSRKLHVNWSAERIFPNCSEITNFNIFFERHRIGGRNEMQLSTAEVGPFSYPTGGVEFLKVWPWHIPKKPTFKRIKGCSVFLEGLFLARLLSVLVKIAGKTPRNFETSANWETLKAKYNRFAPVLFNIKVRTSPALTTTLSEWEAPVEIHLNAENTFFFLKKGFITPPEEGERNNRGKVHISPITPSNRSFPYVWLFLSFPEQ